MRARIQYRGMSCAGWRTVFLLAAPVLLIALAAAGQHQPRVVDRIVVKIENDILTESELRELDAFQMLLNAGTNPQGSQAPAGKAARDTLLRQLIDQWIVEREADAAQFARPLGADVDAELARVAAAAGGPAVLALRLGELGLSPAGLQRMLERVLRLSRYLDYKFRPAAQVETSQIETYYREEWAPGARASGLAVPPFAAVQETLRELLIQKEITSRAGRWLDEMRSRLKIEFSAESEARR